MMIRALPALSFRLGISLCAWLAMNVSSADLRLDWAEVGGAATASRGGEFSLCGTIGQTEAGVLAGGAVSVESGFWHGATVFQTPNAPRLKIQLLGGGRALISWPVAATGFALEQSSGAAGPFSLVLVPVVDTASEHTVTVSLGHPVRCYRLTRIQP
jgi:hypothetical protein